MDYIIDSEIDAEKYAFSTLKQLHKDAGASDFTTYPSFDNVDRDLMRSKIKTHYVYGLNQLKEYENSGFEGDFDSFVQQQTYRYHEI